MSDTSGKSDETLDRLLKLNQELFAQKHYEAAYEVLAAAVHYANDTRNMEQLLSIGKLADEQGSWLDTNVPDHPMGTQAAVGRRGANLYTVLVRQASAHARAIELGRRRAESSDSTT